MEFDDQGIFGFDISRWQDNNETAYQTDFTKMVDYGASFVIIKAGQWYWEDEDFEYNWREAKAAGLAVASYWFADKNETGKEQANTYFKILERNGWNGEPCVVDYETGSWTDWNELYDFLVELQTLTKLPSEKIFIYTGYPYWTEHSPLSLASRQWFKQFPLWLAWYTSNPSYVRIPDPWTEVLLWQDGTPAIGIEVGVESKEIDHDKFNGNLDKFKLYFKTDGVIIEPPTGGDNMLYKGTTLVRLNVRELPVSNGQWLMTMDMNLPIEADEITTDGWWHLTKRGSEVVTREEWAFQGDTNGYIRLDATVDPTPTGDTFTLHIVMEDDGTVTGTWEPV